MENSVLFLNEIIFFRRVIRYIRIFGETILGKMLGHESRVDSFQELSRINTNRLISVKHSYPYKLARITNH